MRAEARASASVGEASGTLRLHRGPHLRSCRFKSEVRHGKRDLPWISSLGWKRLNVSPESCLRNVNRMWEQEGMLLKDDSCPVPAAHKQSSDRGLRGQRSGRVCPSAVRVPSSMKTSGAFRPTHEPSSEELSLSAMASFLPGGREEASSPNADQSRRVKVPVGIPRGPGVGLGGGHGSSRSPPATGAPPPPRPFLAPTVCPALQPV